MQIGFFVRDGVVRLSLQESGEMFDLNTDLLSMAEPCEVVPSANHLKLIDKEDLVKLANAGDTCRGTLKMKKDALVELIISKWGDIVASVKERHQALLECGVHVPTPVVNSEVSGDSDGRVLMLAFTPQGFKALAIPNGCIVDLMPPIQQRVLMDYDISHDDNAIKQLLDKMPMTKLMQMWHSLGVQGFEDGMSRGDLVEAMLDFIQTFRISTALSSTRLQPPQQQTSQEFQYFSGGGYKLGAFESCNINEKPEDYKGALSIFFDNDGKKITFTFFYDLHSKVQDVYDALVKLGLEVGDDKPYKLAWPGDGVTLGSTLHGWEPVFATLHEVKKVVITTSIKDGGFRNPKVVKKLMSKEERLQTAKVEASKIKSTGGKIDFVATADKVLSDFFTLAESSPADAIEESVKKLSEEEITSCLEAVSGNCGGTTAFKLCHLSRYIFGESIRKVIDLNASTAAIVETCRLTMEMAYDKGIEDGSVSMPWIRQILNDYLNRRIGAPRSHRWANLDFQCQGWLTQFSFA